MAKQVHDDDRRRPRHDASGPPRGRDPERLEAGGKRLQADETRSEQLGADTDGDLDGDARD